MKYRERQLSKLKAQEEIGMSGGFESVEGMDASWSSSAEGSRTSSYRSSMESTTRNFSSSLRNLENLIKEAERDNRQQDIKNLALQVAQLKEIRDLKHMELQRNFRELEARSTETRRDFALWRQTPDGKDFEKWCAIASEIHGIITEGSREWTDQFNSEVEGLIPNHEKLRARDRLWVQKPELGNLFYIFVTVATIGLVGAIGLQVLLRNNYEVPGSETLLTMLMMLAFFGIPAAAITAYLNKNGPSWRKLNAQKGQEASTERRSRFGYDPLAGEAPPSQFLPGTEDYAREVKHFALIGYEVHPSPKELPALHFPQLRNDDEIVFEPMRAKVPMRRATLAQREKTLRNRNAQ